MQNVIYYPGFEVTDENWLKFALIYIEKLRPIIPYDAQKQLSKTHYILKNETNLIEEYRPSVKEGQFSTIKTINIVENMLRNPEPYKVFFKDNDFLEKWKNPEYQNSILFWDKYTKEWELFCLSNNIGCENKRGIKLSSELIKIYMTILAQNIADRNSISAITDLSDMDNFRVFTEIAKDNHHEKIEISKALLRIKIPKRLSEISLDRVIYYRNRPDYISRLRAFHNELNKFINNANSENDPVIFSSEYSKIWNDFSGELLKLSGGLITTSIGIWLLANTGGMALPLFTGPLAGLLSITGGSITIKNSWKNSRNKRYCRKFIADLKELND